MNLTYDFKKSHLLLLATLTPSWLCPEKAGVYEQKQTNKNKCKKCNKQKNTWSSGLRQWEF